MALDIQAEHAVRAFEQGFAVGANPLKRAGGHAVDSGTHKHWRTGYEAGRRAVDTASARYRQRGCR